MRSVTLKEAAAAVTHVLGGRPADWKGSTSADACRRRCIWVGLVFELSHRQVSVTDIAKAAGVRSHCLPVEEIERWFMLPWWTRHSWLRLACGYLFDGWNEDVRSEVQRLATAVHELESGTGDWPSLECRKAICMTNRPRITAATLKGLVIDGKALRRRSTKVRRVLAEG